MPYTVYVLKSLKNGRFYYGSTCDLDRRLKEHNSGQSKYTNLTKPFIVIYSEEYPKSLQARKRERQLKKMKSKKYIEDLINTQVAE